MRHSIGWINVSLLGIVVACGKPMDPNGGEAEFVKASMVGDAAGGAERRSSATTAA